MSYTKDVVVYPELRPPVASVDGLSPLRGRRLTNIFRTHARLANMDPVGADSTAKVIVEKYTDDGMLAPGEDKWNSRHQISPSKFNERFHTYYKQFFDKKSHVTQPVLLNPKRELDPYEVNERKGTRMPDNSIVSRDRDIYGELGWIPNFNVKCSKNNTKWHPTNREYFDAPMNYHVTFNNSTMTNSEFFRQNAPLNSVARERVKTLSVQNTSKFGSTMRSTQSTFQTSIYATPFVLDRDVTNKYKVIPEVEKTSESGQAIPFLRASNYDWKKHSRSPRALSVLPSETSKIHQLGVQTFTAGFGVGSRNLPKASLRERKKQISRENGWNSYVKPISKYNEKVHSSMKISFDRI